MKIKVLNNYIIISELEFFSVAQTFDCGQSFRFTLRELSSEEKTEISEKLGIPCNEGSVWRADGIAFGRRISFIQPSESTLLVTPCTLDDFEKIWKHYLSLDTDYAAIRENMRKIRPTDQILNTAMDKGKGIRILRQEPWEALCTFIISQNNNIPRITGLVKALCQAAGNDLSKNDAVIPEKNNSDNSNTDPEKFYSFPSPEAVKALGTDGLFALRTGFRAAYLFDAASKVASGEVDISSIQALPTAEAEAKLRTIKGVGPKVAACSLLFGFEKDDAFPVDVWVKRVLAQYYPEGISPEEFGDHAGLAQQYLFYYQRYRQNT